MIKGNLSGNVDYFCIVCFIHRKNLDGFIIFRLLVFLITFVRKIYG